MRLAHRWLLPVLAAATALFAQAAAAAPQPGVDVRLSAATPVLYGNVDVNVTVTVTNVTRHPINVPAWQLPDDDLSGKLFKITREDGAAVKYLGPVVKRAQDNGNDKVRIDPGASVDFKVELTAQYDLSKSGRYAIEYSTGSGHGAQGHSLKSGVMYLWLEGRNGKVDPTPPPPSGGPAYSSCSASQQTALQAATTQAISYANGAVTYLNGTPGPTQRYVKWFGAYSLANWATAKSHYQAIQSAFTTQPLAYDCKCKKPSVYAYVYPNQPYKIYLCGAFWNAPVAGTDSRGGTLIHEMSHFDIVAGTDDWVYGQSGAANLAATDPVKALNNADNHEYFAENTPALP